jgi:hypothetical protein
MKSQRGKNDGSLIEKEKKNSPTLIVAMPPM